MRYTIRPISDRTPFGGARKPNPFRAKWADTLDLLDVELSHLKARDVVFEVDVVDESQIRLDGMLRANAKVASGAVRLAFDSMHGPLTYATDRYRGAYYSDPPDWQINLRAIALGLEALRKVERYGITKRGEQYAGWKALPGGRAMPPSHMTTEQAYDVLAELLDLRDIASLDVPDATLIRRAKAAAHPDRNGGSRSLWDQVEQAARVLGADR